MKKSWKSRLQLQQMFFVKDFLVRVSLKCLMIVEEFESFLTYCFELGFDERPDYNLQKIKFWDLYSKLGFINDSVYDWNALSVKLPLPSPDSKADGVEIKGLSNDIRR